MRSARVIIGANFGDEGKGLMTDYLSDPGTLVVRYGSGGQAGHTVCVPDGRRHVFHHVGAGSLQGASTYLSEFFVVTPELFNREVTSLKQTCGVDLKHRVYVSPRCPVTTPHDVMINMILEETRGEARHGSCGTGFHETIVRSERPFFQLWFEDLPAVADAADLHWKYQVSWTERRLKELCIDPPDHWKVRLGTRKIFDHFINEWDSMYRSVIMVHDPRPTLLNKLIFEGAQGLLLDQDHKFFPHVTHSHTGLTNVDILARRWRIEHLDVTYVTRSYVTRHGRGPFPKETPNVKFYDDTNRPNEWQESLRFGEISPTFMKETIAHDVIRSSIPKQVQLAVTHLDQTGDMLMAQELAHCVGAEKLYVSHGPTRDDVHQV